MAGAPLVLIAEDEMLVAMDLEDRVRALGYAVLGPAPTVARALSLVDDGRPDVALLDCNLRGELVTPLAERLGALGIPAVLITGYDAPHLPDGPLRQLQRLHKPVDTAILETTLRDATAR